MFDEIIAESYYSELTRTLDLSGALKDKEDLKEAKDICNVLHRIKQCVFYTQIDRLILSHNQFENVFNSDSPQLPEWPPNLKVLDLSNNRLTGSKFPWEKLPQKLEELYLQNNRLYGSVDWSLLPERSQVVWIFNNEFGGGGEWNALPPNLYSLGLSSHLAEEFRAFVMDKAWIKDSEYQSDEYEIFTKKTGYKAARYDFSNEFQPGAEPPDVRPPDRAYRMKIGLLLLSIVMMAAPTSIYAFFYLK